MTYSRIGFLSLVICFCAVLPLRAEDSVLTLSPDHMTPAILKYGVTFDDTYVASDGGLYHEMLGNRDFEVNGEIRTGWNAGSFWTISGEGATMRFVLSNPIHPDNPNSVVFTAGSEPAMLRNRGFNGNCFSSFDNTDYHFSCMVRNLSSEENVPLSVRMVDPDRGTLYGETKTTVSAHDWTRLECDIHIDKGFYLNGLELQLTKPYTSVQVDMLSLKRLPFYKNRKDGLRNNIATDIESLHPDFFRFPGVNLLQGDCLNNMYRWKNTIGPLETRIRQKNATDSYPYEQTAGLGFFELFQFAEDIGAEPLPVYSVGVSNSVGRNQMIPMRNMSLYAEDLTDLLDYALAKPESSKWASERDKAGHNGAFAMKTVQIFCPTAFSDACSERCTVLADAVRKHTPDFRLIFDAGTIWNVATLKSAIDFAQKNNAASIALPTPADFGPEYIDSLAAYLDAYDKTQPGLAFYSIETQDKFLFSAMLMTLERHADIVSHCSVASVVGRNCARTCVTFTKDGDSKLTDIGDAFQRISQVRGDAVIPGELKSDIPIAWSAQKMTKTGELILKFTNTGNSSVKIKIAGLEGNWQCSCLYRSDRKDASPIPYEFGATIDVSAKSISIYKLIPSASTIKQ